AVYRGQGGAGRVPDGRRGDRGTRGRDRGQGVGRAGAGRRAAAATDRGAPGDGAPTQRGPATSDAEVADLRRAVMHGPCEGLPDNPRGWLIQTAVRRLTDQYRSDQARRRREESATMGEVRDAEPVPRDDALLLLFMCCHPALPPASSIALTLRAVAGLSTAEIATAFLVPEATMA